MNAPSEDFATYLDAATSLALTYATNLFVGEIPDVAGVPDKAVVVIDSGGFEDEAGYEYERPTFQVAVRGARGEYIDARDLAAAIKAEIHGLANAEIGGARYVGVWATTSPLYVGKDEKGRPLFTVNFRVHRTSA